MATTSPPATSVAPPESPRLRALLTDLATSDDRQSVLAAFWREVEASGTPLVEEHDANLREALLTFVYRETEASPQPLERVLLVEWLTHGDFNDKGMVRLADTDVWFRSIRARSDLRTSYQIAPNDSLLPRREETDWQARFAGWQADPLNRHPLIEPGTEAADDGRSRASSVIELPDAPPQPWIVRHPETPRGTIHHHRFASEIVRNERDVWIATPATGVMPESPVVVIFDGERHKDVLRVPTVLDNLNASGLVPPVVAVIVGNVERGDELPCNPDFLAMLRDELLPWAAAMAGVVLKPERTAVAGVSYGGLAAMYCGLFAPERFGLVLSQSGSFWWKPDPMNAASPVRIGDAPEYSWLPREASTMPLGDIRVWMEAGTMEDRSHGSTGPSLLTSNRHMRDVLVARGVPVMYREFIGGHDYAWWRNSLADGLIALLRYELAHDPDHS